MAASPVGRRPQTLKQAKKAYQKNGGVKKLSERELRQIKRAAELQERATRIKDREARRKLNLQKKEEKFEKERRARAEAGLKEEPIGRLGKVGASQCRLDAQWFSRNKSGTATNGERRSSEEEFEGEVDKQRTTCDEHEQADEWSPPMSAQKLRHSKRTVVTTEQGHIVAAVTPNRHTLTRVPLGAIDGNARTASQAKCKSTAPTRSNGVLPQSPSNSPTPYPSSPKKQSTSHRRPPQAAYPGPNAQSPKQRAIKPTSSITKACDTSHSRAPEHDQSQDPINRRKAMPPRKPVTTHFPPRHFLDDWDLIFPSNTQVEREIFSPTNRGCEMRQQRTSSPSANRSKSAMLESQTHKGKSLRDSISSKTLQRPLSGSPVGHYSPSATQSDRISKSITSSLDFLFGISTQDLEDDLMEEERSARTSTTRTKVDEHYNWNMSPTTMKLDFDHDPSVTLHDEALLSNDESKAKPHEGVLTTAKAPKLVGAKALTTHGAEEEANQRQAYVGHDSFSSDYYDFGSQEIADLEGLMAGT